MPEPIRIDVWSDIACPWCYIGKRKLEAGIAAFAGDPDAPAVAVEYHSYQLQPDAPEEVEGSAAQALARHLGTTEADARQMQDRVAGIAATVGLDYDFEAQRPANTLAGHQVLHLAKAHGVQAEAKERLLRAHFVEGRHVGHHDELAALGAEVGLDPDEVRRSLAEQEHLPAVRADQRRAHELGITGVPFVVVDDRFGISGAQPPEVFAEALTRARADRSPADHQEAP